MTMQPRIETIKGKKLIGQRLKMSFAHYRIAELWQGFGPKRKEITNALNNHLISMVVYPPTHFTDFSPVNEFERWAAVEVVNYQHVPVDLETFDVPGGRYAVFEYKGSSVDNTVFEYILKKWLPYSPYELDDRPHFEVLGERYKNNDPESEEEIWVPIKEK